MLQIKHRLDFKLLGERVTRFLAISLSILTLFIIWLTIITGNIESWIYLPYITVSLAAIGSGCLYYYLVDFYHSSRQTNRIFKIGTWVMFIIVSWFSFIFALSLAGLWD